MTDPLTLLLKWLGYERKEPSELLKHMVAFTHNSWLKDLNDSNRIEDYKVELYTK